MRSGLAHGGAGGLQTPSVNTGTFSMIAYPKQMNSNTLPHQLLPRRVVDWILAFTSTSSK
ncbi:hypothetical protein DL89DRAFT_268387 [Linderina pennispora]|uniref:Uncharacterized protein n=1 Tax=Linderina pennispora TaxID=61395 RepID=A0A1Y1W4X2_9FUNG|nr:uncharacterized protein DL89DRAFT_268387 [Linderina pennispora]ORX68579.1 hypothetical protein DL89DRAFT_268387 [Linderina pennispora]